MKQHFISKALHCSVVFCEYFHLFLKKIEAKLFASTLNEVMKTVSLKYIFL